MKIALEINRDVKSIKEVLETAEHRQAQELLSRYPAGYVLFGIDLLTRKTESVIPHDSKILEEYDFRWSRAGVSDLKETSVTIEMPDIHYRPLGTLAAGTAMILGRRPLGRQYRYPVRPEGSTHRIFVELLQDDSSQFVFVIGFKQE
jgi:hypothetical protein